MLLTLTTTHQPATDLGYLLHKHPDKFQTFPLTFGKAHIFYPESNSEKSTIALLLDIDAIALVKQKRNARYQNFSLGQYVNDRPYIASSFMSVALSKTFSTAMNGKCKDKPEMVDIALPLAVKISVVSAPKGGEILIRKLFEPLGYQVNLERHILDDKFTEWGESKYFNLNLKHTIELKKLLTHLYVLLPVLDNDKHYYVSKAEVDKLLERGKGWLESHPEKDQIIKRYLNNIGTLSRQALNRLVENEELSTSSNDINPKEQKRKETLHQKRLKLVLEQLKLSGAQSVLDLGCGEGKLLKMLLKEKQFKKITGTDVSFRELNKAKDKLYWDEMAPRQKERIELFQGALTYRDKRLEGYDAAAIVEVIEHLDEDRLQAFEKVIFEFARPDHIVLTTPNSEYNVLFESMEAGTFRHKDHRFEWTRKEFKAWANRVGGLNGYTVSFLPIGEEDKKVGAPSQMAVFSKKKL